MRPAIGHTMARTIVWPGPNLFGYSVVTVRSMALKRLETEIDRLDQDICSILLKNPRSREDDLVLEHKRLRLAEARKELKEEEDDEKEYQRKVADAKALLELKGALSVFLALRNVGCLFVFPTGPRTRLDITASYVQKLVDMPISLASEDDLQKVLIDPLPGTIFVHPGTYPASLLRSVLPFEELRSDASEDTYKLSYLIYSGFDRPEISGSEESMASAADFLTSELWLRLHAFIGGFSLQMAKNLVDPSGVTQLMLRPDFCLWVNGALLLKGEHKRAEGDLNCAISELGSKMKGWNPVALRGLSFLPCFAVGGRHIQFCAVFPPLTEGSEPVVKTVSSIHNMGDPATRLWVIRMSLNMLRVLVYLSRKIMWTPMSLYREVARAGGSSIVVMDECVVKTCVPARPEVYTCLSNPFHLPYATRVTLGKPLKNGMHALEIRPVCFLEAPQSLKELRIAIKGVLTALAELHKRKCVHRDVRWPNILKDKDRWILSDFEMAELAGTPLSPGAIASCHLPPEIQSNSTAGYETAGDIFCVGKLVEAWRGTESLPEEARSWSRRLTNADATARPTAQQLLEEEDSWLGYNDG